MFPCLVVSPRYPIRSIVYAFSNHSCFTPYWFVHCFVCWWTRLSKSGRIGIGAVENVNEEDGERNLRISVYDEGKAINFFWITRDSGCTKLIRIRNHIIWESCRWNWKTEKDVFVAVVDLALWSILSFAMIVNMFFFKLHGMKTPSRSYWFNIWLDKSLMFSNQSYDIKIPALK